MKRYEYLLFDVDNTLLDFDRAEHEAMVQTLSHFGHGGDAAEMERLIAVYSEVNEAHWKMLERGEIDRPTLLWRRFAVFAERCGLGPWDAQAVCDVYVDNLSRQRFLCPDAEQVCRALADRYTLCAITNGNTKVQHGRWDPCPLYPFFKATFISDEMGADKPSKAYFDMVRAALPDLDPARTLVIGDSLTSDIAGGVVLGSDTCWVCRDAGKRGAAAAAGLSPTFTVTHLRQLLDIL